MWTHTHRAIQPGVGSLGLLCALAELYAPCSSYLGVDWGTVKYYFGPAPNVESGWVVDVLMLSLSSSNYNAFQ